MKNMTALATLLLTLTFSNITFPVIIFDIDFNGNLKDFDKVAETIRDDDDFHVFWFNARGTEEVSLELTNKLVAAIQGRELTFF